MEDTRSVEMNDEERDEFLGTGGTGVASFPRGSNESPHTIPVSYGYDSETGEFYFRLAFSPETEKEGVVGDRKPISFVTYDETDTGWRSVVATGRLEEVAEAAIDSDVVTAMRRIHIPLVDVFDRNPREIDFRFFHLDPEELSGKKEARTEADGGR
jgi:nitroimidazol reductase NimA-like FMN-containing flavoprotein (pyridoxamine 5'-phosphate oxidase superfamily)